MPLTNLTVFAWLPSASPSALTYSPDFFKSSSSVVMNLIISSIHSLPIVASPSSADPNVMIMYFIASLLGIPIRRFRDVVEAAQRFSTSMTSQAALKTGHPRFLRASAAPRPAINNHKTSRLGRRAVTIHRLRSDHGIAGACPWDGIGRLTALCARDVGFEISAGAGD